MKAFMVLALAALVSAEPPSNYGAPQQPQYVVMSNYGAPSQGYGAPAQSGGYQQAQQGGYGAPAYVPQVFRHVYVHAAPDEPEFRENKVVRVPGGGDKHVNIIFVKAPSHSSQQQTEVILPDQPEQKTVVYVLVKKAESYNNVKVTAPAPSRPQKPEVFFIRYKNKEAAAPAYGPPQTAYGSPAPVAPSYAPVAVAQNYGPPPSSYGAPSQGYQG